MKRIAILALPMLATIVAIGIGLYLVRGHGTSIATRFGAARGTVADALDEATHVVEEALE